jgi:hypothetical protein
MRPKLSRRVAALPLALLLAGTWLVAATSGAQAITGDPSAPQTLPASNSSMWQTNGSVWALAYSNGVVYAGGDFTAICPPGTAAANCTPTTGGTPMAGIAAFHATGADVGSPCSATSLCPGIGAWLNPKIVGRVWALSVTPDSSKLFAGGDLTSSDGINRGKIVGFDLTRTASRPAKLQLTTPSATGQVRSLATTNDTAYVGGGFPGMTDIDGTAVNQPQLASWDLATGQLRTTWAPTVDGNVDALMIGPGSDSGNVVLGGTFRNVNGESHSGVAQLSQTDATNGPMSTSIVPDVVGTTHSDVKTLTTDGTSIFLGAEGTGYGIFDGTASINPSTGNANWQSTCLGATQAIAVVGGALYIGSHSHNCSSLSGGGFGQLPFNGDYRSWHHLIAEQTGSGQLLNWFPTVNNGPTTDASYLGPRAMATDGTTLFVGGEFTTTTVNGVASPQRGLIRFTPGADATVPMPTTPTFGTPNPNSPTVTSPAPGQVTLRYAGFADADDRTLSYTVTRSDGTTVSTSTGNDSPFWQSPDYVVRDANVPAGTYTYTVTATDADGQQGSVSSAPVTVAAAPTGGYAAAVEANNPASYWRLDEASGTVAADSSPLHTKPGTYRGGPTLGRPGAIGSDAAIAVSDGRGVSNVSGSAAAAPLNYTLETWIRTAPGAAKGGRILGWSPTATSTSASANRALYMMNDGQLIYSILTSDGSTCHFGQPYGTPGTCYVMSKQSYNDGTWHHVVATQSATAGLALYVDGVKVNTENEAPSTKPQLANGVWQAGIISGPTSTNAGFTNIPWGPTYPHSFTGDVDEFAVYPTVLTAAQVTAHWKAGE